MLISHCGHSYSLEDTILCMLSKRAAFERFVHELKSTMEFLGDNAGAACNIRRSEFIVELMDDWSCFYSLAEVQDWFFEQKRRCDMVVTPVTLNEMRDWKLCSAGNISHSSGDFFTVDAVRVSTRGREVDAGWDQPILTQVGHDGGILGLLRKRFDGVPHYLCEAKAEPGNYGLVQLSPTLQATFANINKKHGGRSPHFINYFVTPNEKIMESHDDRPFQVIFDVWVAEDGGRLFNKRNRCILVEVDGDSDVSLPSDSFRWLSLYQISKMLHENAWVSPHVRSLFSLFWKPDQ